MRKKLQRSLSLLPGSTLSQQTRLVTTVKQAAWIQVAAFEQGMIHRCNRQATAIRHVEFGGGRRVGKDDAYFFAMVKCLPMGPMWAMALGREVRDVLLAPILLIGNGSMP